MCRKYTRRISYYAVMNQSMFMSGFIHSIFCVLSRDFDATKWQLPFNMWLPFDTTQSVLGWYIMWLLQFDTGVTYCLCLISGSSHFVCCCVYIIAICDHFKYIMRAEVQDSSKIEKNRLYQLKMKLSKAVDTHVMCFE